MAGHLYLHVGPPKSGTTSLQYAIEKIEHPGLVYGGVYQPRGRNIGSLANRLYQGLMAQENNLLQNAKEEVRHLVCQGNQVVISEEMILLTQRKKDWKAKLTQLRELFEDIPTTVVISLRDPMEGLPSLYQQLYNELPLHHRLSFTQFCKSDIASCYDYSLVRTVLAALGYENIHFLSFDAIRRGSISSKDLFGDKDFLNIEAIPVDAANRGEKEESTGQRKMDGVTLKSLGQFSVVRRLIDRSGCRTTRWYRHLVNLLNRVALRRPGYRNLIIPKSSIKRLAASYQRALADIVDNNGPRN